MTRQCFEAITRCVHLVDNTSSVSDENDPAFDKVAKTLLFQVRWLIESFVEKSKALYNCERELTVDEIMIPYKGRYCDIRQYMNAKPIEFGVKCWALASAQSRYVANIIVYLGAGDLRTESENVSKRCCPHVCFGI